MATKLRVVWPDDEQAAGDEAEGGRGESQRYKLRIGPESWPIILTIWPSWSRPAEPGAERHPSGCWVKLETS